MDKSNFVIRMNCTINDPVERRHRLARLYSFFERHFEEKGTVASDQPNPVTEVAIDSQLDEPVSMDENQPTAL